MTSHTDYRPDRTDRILLGGCALIWLAALGAGVAATVALVDLAQGRTDPAGESGTPWFLYVVIAVSAAVILAAVPLLLRARRTAAQNDADPGRGRTRTARRAVVSAAGRRRAHREVPRAQYAQPLPRLMKTATSPVVDRLWLRCPASLACAMGAATLAIGVATYLMAVDTETAAWVLYGVAGVVTVGMAAIPWYFLRELRTHTEQR